MENKQDCRTCPQCKSNKTIAINERFRRCKDCRHVFAPQQTRKYPTYMEIKDAQRTLGIRYGAKD